MDEKKELEMEYDIYSHPKMDEKVRGDLVADLSKQIGELKLFLHNCRSLLSEKEKEIEHWKGDWKKLNQHMESKLNLFSEQKKEIEELKDAINNAQRDNPDEIHCSCVPLLKARIKELENKVKGE